MPRDSWANSRLPKRRVFGSSYARRQAKAVRQANAALRRDPSLVAQRTSIHTVLWFGKFRGQPIYKVPDTYLQWIAKQQWDGCHMQGLATFLQHYLMPDEHQGRRSDHAAYTPAAN